MKSFGNNQKSFTLLEILIAVTVLGILSSSLILLSIGAREKANDTKRKVDLNAIAGAIILYKGDKGTYLTGAFNTVNYMYPKLSLENILVPNYISNMPRDPGGVIPAIPFGLFNWPITRWDGAWIFVGGAGIAPVMNSTAPWINQGSGVDAPGSYGYISIGADGDNGKNFLLMARMESQKNNNRVIFPYAYSPYHGAWAANSVGNFVHSVAGTFVQISVGSTGNVISVLTADEIRNLYCTSFRKTRAVPMPVRQYSGSNECLIPASPIWYEVNYPFHAKKDTFLRYIQVY